MDRAELEELHYIAAIANLPSIEAEGLLCHNAVQSIEHKDVSSRKIQDRRVNKKVPDARRAEPLELHDYVPLYICGRNPMLYVIRDRRECLAMLSLSCDVLDLNGAIVTDGNAASDITSFDEPDHGLGKIDKAITFAGNPLAPSYPQFLERKRRQCAEVLVPGVVSAAHIKRVYVYSDEANERVRECCGLGPVETRPEIFTFDDE